MLSFSAALDKEGRDEAFFLKGVQHLGKLYDFDDAQAFDFLSFQHILDQLDDDFDIVAKLKAVSDNIGKFLFYTSTVFYGCNQ